MFVRPRVLWQDGPVWQHLREDRSAVLGMRVNTALLPLRTDSKERKKKKKLDKHAPPENNGKKTLYFRFPSCSFSQRPLLCVSVTLMFAPPIVAVPCTQDNVTEYLTNSFDSIAIYVCYQVAGKFQRLMLDRRVRVLQPYFDKVMLCAYACVHVCFGLLSQEKHTSAEALFL